jgi:hypothetical protein
MKDRPGLGLTFPLQNFPISVSPAEFASGWRNRPLVDMSVDEIEVLFREFLLLVRLDTEPQ